MVGVVVGRPRFSARIWRNGPNCKRLLNHRGHREHRGLVSLTLFHSIFFFLFLRDRTLCCVSDPSVFPVTPVVQLLFVHWEFAYERVSARKPSLYEISDFYLDAALG